jgi:PAS domain S-box-containing protein
MALPVPTSNEELIREMETLRARLAEVEGKLAEAQEVICAIQSGDVNAVVVSGPQGDQVFTLKDAEYAYRALVEAMNEGAATLGPDGTVLYCNQRLASLLGIPLEQIIGNRVTKLVTAEAMHDFEALIALAWSTGMGKSELDFMAAQSGRVPMYLSLRKMDSEAALCMVATDLTESKKRDELISSGHLANLILENAAEAIAVCDEAGTIIRINQAVEDLCGFNPLFQKFDLALPLEVSLGGMAAVRRFSIFDALSGDRPRALEVRLVCQNAEPASLLLTAAPIKTATGVAGCVLTMTDMTEHKRAEEQLRRLNRALKAQSDSSQALLHASDESAYLREVCHIVTEDCGHAMMWIGFAENDEDKTVRPAAYSGFEDGYVNKLKFTWDGDSEYGRGPTGNAIRTGQPSMCRNMLSDPLFVPWREEAIKRGYASSLVVPLLDDDGAFGVFSIYSREPDAFSSAEVRLLTELAADLSFGIRTLRLRAAHAAVEERVKRQAEMLRLSFDAIIVWRPETGIESWNIGAEQIYGYSESEALGRVSHELLKTVHPTPLNELMSKLREIGHWEGEVRHVAKDGREVVMFSRHQRIVGADGVERILETNRDITDRKRAEEALVRSEKLASVGRMASTIAHEINNPLETIGNVVYLALTDPGATPAVKSYLDVAIQELARVTHITRQTLAFHRETSTPGPVDLRECIDRIVKLYLSRLESRGISVVKRCPEVGPIKAFGGEIQQVISNLLSNSMDAIPDQGRIEFRLSRTLANGSGKVRLTIADTGSGIPPERLARVFEPFFTTKELHGTGLGLWVTKQIVEKHGATIRVRSKLGRGTVFSIVFPSAETGLPV